MTQHTFKSLFIFAILKYQICKKQSMKCCCGKKHYKQAAQSADTVEKYSLTCSSVI